MAKKDRNVIERLEDIENKIPTKEKPKSFFEKTGMHIEEYLKVAKIYAYEEDERSFKKGRRDKTTKIIVAIVFMSLFFVFSVILQFLNKDLEWLLILSASLSLLALIFQLLIIRKQENKQSLQSFWSVEKPEFYITRKEGFFKINKEARHGLLYYIAFVLKTIAFLGVIAVFLYFFLGIDKYIQSSYAAMYFIASAVGYFSFFVFLFSSRQSAHCYYNYVFETDDFCFCYPSYELTEK